MVVQPPLQNFYIKLGIYAEMKSCNFLLNDICEFARLPLIRSESSRRSNVASVIRDAARRIYHHGRDLIFCCQRTCQGKDITNWMCNVHKPCDQTTTINSAKFRLMYSTKNGRISRYTHRTPRNPNILRQPEKRNVSPGTLKVIRIRQKMQRLPNFVKKNSETSF